MGSTTVDLDVWFSDTFDISSMDDVLNLLRDSESHLQHREARIDLVQLWLGETPLGQNG